MASIFGSRFETKAYFKAQSGAETAPKVEFDQPVATALGLPALARG